MENLRGKTHILKKILTTPKFRIIRESHNSKPHKQRTKCMLFYLPKQRNSAGYSKYISVLMHIILNFIFSQFGFPCSSQNGDLILTTFFVTPSLFK